MAPIYQRSSDGIEWQKALLYEGKKLICMVCGGGYSQGKYNYTSGILQRLFRVLFIEWLSQIDVSIFMPICLNIDDELQSWSTSDKHSLVVTSSWFSQRVKPGSFSVRGTQSQCYPHKMDTLIINALQINKYVFFLQRNKSVKILNLPQ